MHLRQEHQERRVVDRPQQSEYWLWDEGCGMKDLSAALAQPSLGFLLGKLTRIIHFMVTLHLHLCLPSLPKYCSLVVEIRHLSVTASSSIDPFSRVELRPLQRLTPTSLLQHHYDPAGRPLSSRWGSTSLMRGRWKRDRWEMRGALIE